MTVVFFLGGDGELQIRNRSGGYKLSASPNRAVMYWSGAVGSHAFSESASPALALVVRYFDGKRSLTSPPGLEHLYRHCNPAWPLDRIGALETCAHDRNHARRFELIHRFFEERRGDKLDPVALEQWLGSSGYCSQCGRVSSSGSVCPQPEFSGRWVCASCVRMHEDAAKMEVRPGDSALFSSLAIYDQDRRLVRESMQDSALWSLELRHGALSAPEEIRGRPCPISALGECGDTNCVTYRFLTPGARPGFLAMAERYVAGELRQGGRRPVLTFLGSGQLYFEFSLLDRLLCGGTPVEEVHLVDMVYGDPSKVAERAALAQFAAWFSQLKVCAHDSIEAWAGQILQSSTADAKHAVLMVDAANLTGEWEGNIRPMLEAALPQGSIFVHLTQGRDEEAVKDKEGEEAPRFAWSEVHRLRFSSGRLTFDRVERRDWELGATGPGIVTA